MSIIVNDNQKDYELPEPGMHVAVCSHALDLGMQETIYGSKERVAIVWELAEKQSNGKPFQIVKEYTKSLGEKSNLRADLQMWRGRAFSKDELAGFDIEKLVGAPVYLNVIINEKNDKRYPNVVGMARLPAGIEPTKTSGEPAPKWIINKIKSKAEDVFPSQAQASLDSEPLPF